jgi:hypothetical protein
VKNRGFWALEAPPKCEKQMVHRGLFKGIKAMSLYGNFTFHHLVGWPEDDFRLCFEDCILICLFCFLRLEDCFC